MIVTAEDNFHQDAEQRHRELNLYRGKHLKPLIKDEYLDRDPVRAEVNHSRWIVNCPWCQGAEFVFVGLPRFLCESCNNDGSSKYLMVIVPQYRHAIENALNRRARVENRNWKYPETVADLNRENSERGVK